MRIEAPRLLARWRPGSGDLGGDEDVRYAPWRKMHTFHGRKQSLRTDEFTLGTIGS